MTNRYALAALAVAISTLPPSAFAEHRLWYPDWSSGSGTCINSNVTAPNNVLFSNDADHDNLYLEETLVSCCSRYYPTTAFNDCIEGGGGTVTGTDEWYAAWTETPQRCAKDCAVSDGGGCGGILGPGSGTTYPTVAECCSQHFGSLASDYCTTFSSGGEYGGSGKYYLDQSENICVQDCTGNAPCGGVVTQSYIALYDTIALCCSTKLPGLDADFCEAQTNPAIDATNKWFVEGSICKKDCTGTGSECGSANAYDTLYDTAAACCEAKLGWATKEFCESRSDPATHGVGGEPYTGLWFEDYQNNVCVKDCATSTDPTCDSTLESASIKLFSDANTCCTTKLSWIPIETCEPLSISGEEADATGTSKWYGDYSSAKRCVMDCPSDSGAPSCGGVVSNSAGVTMYDDVTDCCAGKFQWYQQDLCKALSEAGPGNSATTNLWYVKYGDDNVCVQDCPAATATPACAGNPTNFGEPMYASAEECCEAKLKWVDADQCKVKSENGADSANVASNKWYADYSGKKCAKDCETSGGGGCNGIVTSTTGLAMFDDVEACCADRFGWVNEDLCKALSDGSGYSQKYYPDQGKGICHQDCASSNGGLCNGNPSDRAVKMYDTAEACCSGSVGWVKTETCTQVPASEQGTEDWWINWQLRKCVKNCDGSTGSCGGLANSWDPLFSSASTCCSQPAFTQVELSDCQKS